MTSHPAPRPPTFTYESEVDWSGRRFPTGDAAITGQACGVGQEVSAAEVTLPIAAADQPTGSNPSGDDATTPDAAPLDSTAAALAAAATTATTATTARRVGEADPGAAGEPVAAPEAEALVGDVFADLLDEPPTPPAAPRAPAATPTPAPAGPRTPAATPTPAAPPRANPGAGDPQTEVVESVACPLASEGVGTGLADTDPAGTGGAAGDASGQAVARLVWSQVLNAAPGLVREDATAAVAAGELAYLRALVDPRPQVREQAGHRAGQAAQRAATRTVAVLGRGGRDRGEARGQMPWDRAGLVIPVLGAGSGVGASVTAAAVFDALDTAGIPTLLIDAAEPARSGLTRATGHAGNAADRRPHPEVGIAFAPRGGGWVAALSAPPDELLTDAVVPSPGWWLPARNTPTVTVVDLGWDPWVIAAGPLRGSGVWLEAGDPAPAPLLVTTATRPGIGKTRELLDRLRPWTERGLIAAPTGLVVVGARRWPRELRPIARRQLGALAEQAVLLPRDRAVAVAGVGPDPLPARLRAPFAPLLRRWGLPVTAASTVGRFWRGH